MHLLKAKVFLFQRYKLFQRAYVHPATFHLLSVKSAFADPMLADKFFQRDSHVGFFQDADDLGFGELGQLHVECSWTDSARRFHFQVVLC
jgi:hypothetical protein